MIDLFAVRNGMGLLTLSFLLVIGAQTSAQWTGHAGGAIFTWIHPPFGSGSPEDIYAQRVDAPGSIQWIEGGVVVSDAQNTQATPRILSDNRGGAIVVWFDLRNGEGDIYAQRIDSLGNQLWGLDAIAVCEVIGSQTDHYVVADGEGGALVSWRDFRAGTNELYAQRIDSSGIVRWATGGLRVATQATRPYRSLMVSDRQGGFVIVWNEEIDPGGLHAQRVNRSGLVQWNLDGVTMSGLKSRG